VKADLDKLEERLAGRECFGGLDLARVNDLSAFVLVFPPQEIPTLDALATAALLCSDSRAFLLPLAIRPTRPKCIQVWKCPSFQLRKCTPRSHWFLYNGDWTPRDERGYISGLATVFASEGNEP
jgi:hypothetical protein